MDKKTTQKPKDLSQRFALEVRFIPLSPEEKSRRYSRLQELFFKGARKCAQDEEKNKA